MRYDEAEAYRHASHGCTTPDGDPCIYCDAEAADDADAVRREAARLEALVNEDYERWSHTLALTNPIPSVFLSGGK